MALTDLTGTKWRINDAPLVIDATYSLTFIISELTYRVVKQNPVAGMGATVTFARSSAVSSACIFYGTSSTYNGWYSKSSGTSDATFTQLTTPPTIEITGGTDATNPTLISWIQTNAEQIIDASVKLLKSGTSVIGKINDHYVSSVNGTNVMSGIVADTPTGYDVTITFQNGTDTAYWQSTRIFDDFDTYLGSIPATAQQIGSISSADGSTTVTTTTGKLAIFSEGGAMSGFPEPDVTGEIVTRANQLGFYGGDSGALWTFDVTSDGTITISRMIWDD